MLFLILFGAMGAIGIGENQTNSEAALEAPMEAEVPIESTSTTEATPTEFDPDKGFPVAIYGTEVEMIFVTTANLSASEQEVFENDFDVGLYYSAFAVGKSGGYGFSLSTNDMESARAIALSECRRFQPICRIHAEVYPVGFLPAPAGTVTMGSDAMQYYAGVSQRASFNAMAVGPDGAYSVGWGYDDQASANIGTLADCDTYRATELEGFVSAPCVLVELQQ